MTSRPKRGRAKSFSTTLVAATTAACGGTQAAVVLSPTVGSGLQPPASPGFAFWDVDNDGTNDFLLANVGNATAFFNDYNAGQRGRLVVPAASPANGILKLASGVQVQATMPGAKFHNFAQNNNIITYNTTSGRNLGGPAAAGGWSLNSTGLFGFRFTIGSDIHYGYGQMTISSSFPFGRGFEIDYAYYEDTPNTPITAVAVPEPSSLALLALGAVGAGALSRRRRAGSSD
jgi:hypothetical protein